MSNIKQFEIVGKVPFDFTNHHQIADYLAVMYGPSVGFKIEYGKQSFVPIPETNGKMTYYDFKIKAEEAVGDRWIGGLAQALVNAGAVIRQEYILVIDIENGDSYKLPIPNSDPVEGRKERHYAHKKYSVTYEVRDRDGNGWAGTLTSESMAMLRQSAQRILIMAKNLGKVTFGKVIKTEEYHLGELDGLISAMEG